MSLKDKLSVIFDNMAVVVGLQLKALTSLSVLLKGKSGNDVVPIIPQWVCCGCLLLCGCCLYKNMITETLYSSAFAVIEIVV